MKNFIFGVLALGMIACAGGSVSNTEESIVGNLNRLHTEFKGKYIEDAADHKDLMATLTGLNDSIIIYVDELVKSYPQSTAIALQYSLVGESSMKLKKGEVAIKYFELLETNYAKDDNVPRALFNKAYTYEFVMKDTKKAIKAYKHLYKNYPHSKWAENAKSQILYLKNPSFIGE